MENPILIAALVLAASFLYAAAGQAGGTAFLAIIALAGTAAGEMRPTALLLNIVAAGYATWRLTRAGWVDWPTMRMFTVPSMITAFIGGLIELESRIYFLLVGSLLIIAAMFMLIRRENHASAKRIMPLAAIVVGSGAGFLSGLSGIGGGVFLVPQLIAFGWCSPKAAARLSPPFILFNSLLGFVGCIVSGQTLPDQIALFSITTLIGAVAGTAVGMRWVTERATRYLLVAILTFAGIRLLIR